MTASTDIVERIRKTASNDVITHVENGELTVSLPFTSATGASIKIYATDGTLKLSSEMYAGSNLVQINVSSLQSDIYYLKISTEEEQIKKLVAVYN